MEPPRGMVDISSKAVTLRTAQARGIILLGAEAFAALKQGSCPMMNMPRPARSLSRSGGKETAGLISPRSPERKDGPAASAP